MRVQTIELQNPDGSRNRWIGDCVLSDLIKQGAVDVFEKRAKGKKQKRKQSTAIVARLKPKIEPLRSIYEASAPSITMSDMLANVGLTRDSNSTAEISRGRILQARAKINAFSTVVRCVWPVVPAEGLTI